MKVGVVGGGRIAATSHLPVLAANPRCEIDLVEPDIERRSSLERLFRLRRSVGSLDEAETWNWDAILVMVPHEQMFEVALDCLKFKLPILLEKPPGMTLNETKELHHRAIGLGVRVMVGFQRRFNPILKTGLEQLREHTRIRSLTIEQRLPSIRLLQAGGVPESELVNILPTQFIHHIDYVRFLMGKPAEISAFVGGSRAMPDLYAAQMVFEDGSTAQIHYSLLSADRSFRMSIIGEETALVEKSASNGREVLFEFGGEVKVLSIRVPQGQPYRPFLDGFVAQDNHFLDCVADQRDWEMPASNLGDAIATMELLELIGHRQLGGLSKW